MIIHFDTETTSLCPGRIIQLSYIMQEKKNTEAKNFFFYTSYVEPSAVAVHGFTPEKLAVLSGGRTFSTCIDEIDDDFQRADLVISHNFGFDEKFMSAEFGYEQRLFKYRDFLCSMKFFTEFCNLKRRNGITLKYPKLEELCTRFGIYPYDVTRTAMYLFDNCDVCAHDARYDTTALYLCMLSAQSECPDYAEIASNKL